MKNKKTEEKAFRLFTDRCKKLNYQYFVETDREQPMCFWWYRGLSREECFSNGCCITVGKIENLWNHAYRFMKRHKQELSHVI